MGMDLIARGMAEKIGSRTEEIIQQIENLSVTPLITESTTARTLGLTDINKYIRCTNNGITTITIPNNATIAFSIGTVVNIRQATSGTVTLLAASGVTIDKKATSTLNLSGYGAVVTLIKTAANTWDLFGELADV